MVSAVVILEIWLGTAGKCAGENLIAYVDPLPTLLLRWKHDRQLLPTQHNTNNTFFHAYAKRAFCRTGYQANLMPFLHLHISFYKCKCTFSTIYQADLSEPENLEHFVLQILCKCTFSRIYQANSNRRTAITNYLVCHRLTVFEANTSLCRTKLVRYLHTKELQ